MDSTLINTRVSSHDLASVLSDEDAVPTQTVADVLAELARQLQRAEVRAAQAAADQGDTGPGKSHQDVLFPEQFGANDVPFDPLCDHEVLDRTRGALAQLERDVTLYAEEVATQERRLAHARQQVATGGCAQDWAWVEIWQDNVQHTREGYEGIRALLRETRARYALMIAALEASLARSRATEGRSSNGGRGLRLH